MAKISISKVSTYTGHKDCIYTLEKAGFSNSFFSGGGDGLVAKWDLSNGKDGQLIARLPNSVYAICYDHSRNILIIGQNFEGIHIIDLTSNKELWSLKLNDAAIFDIKINDRLIFAGMGDGTLFVIDMEERTILKKIKLSEKSARTIALNKMRDECAIGFSDHSIKILGLTHFKLNKDIKAHKNSVFTLKYSPDNRFLFSGSRDAHLKIWDVNNDYQLKESIVAHMYAINSIDFSPDNNYFVTCSMDKSIKVWDADEFKLLKVIDKARHAGHGTSVNKLAWLDYKNLLVSASDDRSISVWDIKIND